MFPNELNVPPVRLGSLKQGGGLGVDFGRTRDPLKYDTRTENSVGFDDGKEKKNNNINNSSSIINNSTNVTLVTVCV